MRITGIHHITAMSGDPQRNVDFYAGLLGLRLVKWTVNYDDPGTCHLYYGDGAGNPGTILTFFPWPGAIPGTVGAGMVQTTSFAVPPGALAYWQRRLAGHGVSLQPVAARFGEPVLAFDDADGMHIELIETGQADPARIWAGGPVPADTALRGFHSATLLERETAPTAALLTGTMELELVDSEGDRSRYALPGGGASRIVDVVASPEARRGRVSSGTVHHIAWRTPGDVTQLSLQTGLMRQGYSVSPVMDRTYFHSIYWREPGGVLFEVATDPPGFAIDEPAGELGSRLVLPSWLEPMRETLVRKLPPLELPRAVERVS